MKKMKAFVRLSADNQDVQLADVPVPTINADEVLVKVEAFGVGIHDRYFIPADAAFPYIIGSEGAGTIVETGSQVTGFSLQDRVLFTTILQPQGGTWATYAVANQASLVALPNALSFAQAATIPIAGKTALECMRELQLTQGDTLFIAGASGAIGTILIQLAAASGIRVSGSASAKNHMYMQALGAQKTVDYQDSTWQDQIRQWSDGGVTAALAIQPGTGAASIKVVKTGGSLITVSGDSGQVVAERGITVKQMGHHPDTHQKVTALVKAVAAGEVQVVIEKEYSFNDALEALKKTETRHARGKLVVKNSA